MHASTPIPTCSSRFRQLTNRQIARRLFLAEKTVKNYVSGLFGKLGMQRRAQAAAYAERVFHGQGHAARPGGPADSGGARARDAPPPR